MTSLPPLLEALVNLDRAHAAWLVDVRGVIAGDAACTAALVRWEDRLTLIKLRLHRAEQHLYGMLLHAGPAALGEAGSGEMGQDRQRWCAWRTDFETWFASVHLHSTYRRLESCLEWDHEAVNADVVTDLATLAELAESAGASLALVSPTLSRAELEDFAFYRIVAPWRTRGIPALHDVLRWLSETLREREDW
jgi:hypothetical protein